MTEHLAHDTTPRLRRRAVVGAALIGALTPVAVWPVGFVVLLLAYLGSAEAGTAGLIVGVLIGLLVAAAAVALVVQLARRTPRPGFVAGVALCTVPFTAVPFAVDTDSYAISWWLPTAVLSAAAAIGCSLAITLPHPHHRWSPVTALVAPLALLLLLAPGYREQQAAAELRDTLDAHDHELAVLDDASWHPESLRTTYDGVLDVTYHDTAGTAVQVRSGTSAVPESCQEQVTICTEDGPFLVVREHGAINEVRTELADGSIAAVQAHSSDVDLLALAEQVRASTSEDRELLIDALSSR